MRRSLFCLLFAGVFVAVATAVPAQEKATVPGAIIVTDSNVALPFVPPEVRLSAEMSSANRVAVGVSPIIHTSSDSEAQAAEGGIKGFFFGTRRRTSNTLMIGGVAVAGIGVGVVKGEVGAVFGVLGLLSTIGGLYLAF